MISSLYLRIGFIAALLTLHTHAYAQLAPTLNEHYGTWCETKSECGRELVCSNNICLDAASAARQRQDIIRQSSAAAASERKNRKSPAAVEADTDVTYHPLSEFNVTCRASGIPDTPGLSGKGASCDDKGVCRILVGRFECARVGSDGEVKAYMTIPLDSQVLSPPGILDGSYISTWVAGTLKYTNHPHGFLIRKADARKLVKLLPN